MALYENACKSCASRFETLVRGSEIPECPSCHGTDLERRLSVFAAHTATAGAAKASSFGPSACGSCGDPRGPGACSMN
jgi:putative FmdB family regulatory protein